jgi:hypothetical protein
MNRVLPLTQDGQLRDRYSLIAYCHLVYPESEQSALRALDVINAENDASEAGLQDRFTEIGTMVERRMLKRVHNARLAGYVFYQMVMNKRERGAADFRKAIYAVSEWAATNKTVKGKPLPSDGDNLRKVHFPEFRSALHYWAAFQFLEDHEQFAAPQEPHFTKWMLIAAGILREAEELRLDEGCEPLKDWNPWRVPDLYVQPLQNGEVVYNPPEEDDEIRARIKTYRAKPFENPSSRGG